MKSKATIEIRDNSAAVKKASELQIQRALERCGLKAESWAKRNLTTNKTVDTGNLRNSISHRVNMSESEKAVYIGTNNEYAAYVEFGTGKYREGGGGRPGWWVYVKDSKGGKKGSGKVYTESEAKRIAASLRDQGLDAYATEGMKPKQFLRPALSDHAQEYRDIIKDEMKNG